MVPHFTRIFYRKDAHSIMAPDYLNPCAGHPLSPTCAFALTSAFYSLVPIGLSHITSWQPDLLLPPHCCSRTRTSTFLDYAAPFHVSSTFALNISSLQLIYLSHPAMISSPSWSLPQAVLALLAVPYLVLPLCLVHTAIREHDLCPQVIPSVNLQQGIRHVRQRTATVCSMTCILQICNKFNYSVNKWIMYDLDQVYGFSLLQFSHLLNRNNQPYGGRFL